jgi:hypothetical protein
MLMVFPEKRCSLFGKFTTLAFLTAVALFAQSNQGTITGTVSDPTGAVVPTAQIEIKNRDRRRLSRRHIGHRELRHRGAM